MDHEALSERYRRVRNFTSSLCEPMEPEDCVVQSMPDVSPTRWHLAHTTWFFETFVLQKTLPGYQVFSDDFCFLFNSYYNTVGEQFPRDRRGLLSRPTVAQVWQYRDYVDGQMSRLLESSVGGEVERVIELGLHHEQQHQELMLTDIKHVLSVNPLFPRLFEPVESTPNASPSTDLTWRAVDRKLVEVGANGDEFCFDNELPRHEVLLSPHRLASRLVTNADYLSFIEDGGYAQPALWLSLGWHFVQQNGWQTPLYWVSLDGEWYEFSLHGLRSLQPHEPVCHVSFFEADAYARWKGARLPTEFEWEYAAASESPQGNFADSRLFHPQPAPSAPATDRTENAPLTQLWGDLWEWTSSPYVAFPGYRPPTGALGEYNGKFMCNQYVLRGGSCLTSASHIRATYRNFFPPEARWQATGIRLAANFD